MNFQLFEKILLKRAIYFSIICVIILIISILALKYIFKNMQQEKVLFYILNILCIIAAVGSLVLGGRTIYSSIYDIKNKAYINYCGNFIISNDVENRSGTCSLYLPDKNGLHLETDAYLIDSGEYVGVIIYGEKTKVVLDVETNNIQGDGSPVS